MTSYQVADGKDNAAGLIDISPQPASPDGVRYPELVFSADGSAHFHGWAYIDLVWNSIDRASYNAILTAFGLSQTVAHNAVTVKIRDNDDTFRVYNGDAIRLQEEQRRLVFWKQLTIRVNNLELVV